MAFCTKCGTDMSDDARFCPNCGFNASGENNLGNVAVNPEDHTCEFAADDISKNKVVAMASYILGVIGIIISFLAASESPYASFHARQALKLEIVNALLAFAAVILAITIIVPIAAVICVIILFVVRIICFFDVCAGKAKEPPIISSLPFLK